jgi:hypothetical protein
VRWLGVILFFFFLLPLHAQDEYPDILSLDSFTGVASMEISGYLLQFDENLDTVLIPITQSGFTFSISGAWLTRVGVFPDGNVAFDSTWYDAKTNTRYIQSKNDFDPSLTTIVYDSEGRMINILYAPELRSPVATEFAYDKKGRLAKKTERFALEHRIVDYQYNRKGKLVKKREFTQYENNKNPRLDAVTDYLYNSSGNKIQSTILFYNLLGMITNTDTMSYGYDSRARMILQKETHSNNANVSVTTWTYDDVARTVSRDYRFHDEKGDSSHVVTTVELDSRSYCKHFSEESDDGSGSSLRWDTTYDEKGLPLKCIYTTEAEIILYKWEYTMR